MQVENNIQQSLLSGMLVVFHYAFKKNSVRVQDEDMKACPLIPNFVYGVKKTNHYCTELSTQRIDSLHGKVLPDLLSPYRVATVNLKESEIVIQKWGKSSINLIQFSFTQKKFHN